MQRLASIDVARGLAALSVAAYHHGFATTLARVTHWPAAKDLGWPGAVLAVPVFFVISGFCIHAGSLAQPVQPVGRFLAQRLVRLYPAWVAAIFFSAVIAYGSGRPPGAGQLFTYLTFTNGFFNDYGLNLALWSVSIEWCLYLLYPFWLRFRRRYGLAPAAGLAAAVSLASCLLTARWVPAPTGPALWFFPNVWCGWIAGAVLAEIWFGPRQAILGRTSWWTTGAVLCAAQVVLVRCNVYEGAALYIKMPVSICLCVWPVALLLVIGREFERREPAAWLGFLWRRLAAVGLFSYSLYLLHVPVQSLRFVLLPHSLGSDLAKTVLLVAWFGVVLAAGWLAYRFIEEPGSRWGRQWLRPFRPAAVKPS